MLKIICDRCGKEIKDRVYSIMLYQSGTAADSPPEPSADSPSGDYCSGCIGKLLAFLLPMPEVTEKTPAPEETPADDGGKKNGTKLTREKSRR